MRLIENEEWRLSKFLDMPYVSDEDACTSCNLGAFT